MIIYFTSAGRFGRILFRIDCCQTQCVFPFAAMFPPRKLFIQISGEICRIAASSAAVMFFSNVSNSNQFRICWFVESLIVGAGTGPKPFLAEKDLA